jgi:hypothetical protein
MPMFPFNNNGLLRLIVYLIHAVIQEYHHILQGHFITSCWLISVQQQRNRKVSAHVWGFNMSM